MFGWAFQPAFALKKTNNKKPTHWLAEWVVGDL